MVYPALLPVMHTPRLPVVDWIDASPADLNGLVRFAERRNLVSARVPLLFNWPVRYAGVKRPGGGVDHPPLSSAKVKERLELYLYYLSGLSWHILPWTLPYTFTFYHMTEVDDISGIWSTKGHDYEVIGFWFVTPCRLLNRYQHLGRLCCFFPVVPTFTQRCLGHYVFLEKLFIIWFAVCT